MTESQYLTAIYAFEYFGPARVKLLLSYFESSEKIWKSTRKKLLEVGLPEGRVDQFIEFRRKFDLEKYFKRLKDAKVKVTTILDLSFPKNLKELDGSPLVLYYKGSLDSLKNKSVAIVGTRQMTPYGREVTEKFSGELAKKNITIISGLARGIDTIAHKACLDINGKTVAILGHGLDIVYPPENSILASEIVKRGGAIVSEYPLGYPIRPSNFAIRNRIISGLSDVVLVIEGAEKSGTLLTARHAAEQGKTVLAVPGPITSPLSIAPLYLLKNGAKIATSVSDVLEELI